MYIKENREDQRDLFLMIIISFLIHVLIISFAIASSSFIKEKKDILPLYTVRLIGPSDLGLQRGTHPEKGEGKGGKNVNTLNIEKKLTLSKKRVQIDEKGPIVLPKIEPVTKEKKDLNAELERVKKKIEAMRIEDEEREKMKGSAPGAIIQEKVSESKSPPLPSIPGERGFKWRVQSTLLAEYATVVKERVRQNWSFPRTNETFSAIISIQVAMDGRIEDIRFEKRSGNSQFDESILRALRKTVLPPPPELVRGEVFVITFHSNEARTRT
jgi:TonB family protein